MLLLANGHGLVGLALSILLTSAFSCIIYVSPQTKLSHIDSNVLFHFVRFYLSQYIVLRYILLPSIQGLSLPKLRISIPCIMLEKVIDTGTHSDVINNAVRSTVLYHYKQIHKCQFVGGVYRCGPNSLSFDTTAALQAIYGSKSNCWKGEFYTMFPARKNVYSIHSEVDKERHAHKRRVLSNAFSDGALKGMEEYVLNQIRIFCVQIGSAPQPRNMATQADYLTSDILGDLCFGKSFDMQEKPENRFMCDLIQKVAKKLLVVSSPCPKSIPTSD